MADYQRGVGLIQLRCVSSKGRCGCRISCTLLLLFGLLLWLEVVMAVVGMVFVLVMMVVAVVEMVVYSGFRGNGVRSR